MDEIVSVKDTIFEFDTRTKEIPFDILSNSKEFITGSGKPQATRPEASWVTLQNMMNLLELHNIACRVDKIYVSAEDSNHPLTTEEKMMYGNNIPVKQWIFNRLIAKLAIVIPGTNELEGMNSSIAFAYNKNGIQVAFGTNVDICANFSILHGRVFETYGDYKIQYGDLMTMLGSYIDNLPQWKADEYKTINMMMNTSVGTKSDIDEFLGIMLRSAIQANTERATSPLNITEVSELARMIVSKDPDEYRDVWQLYNMGTQLMNFGGKVNMIEAVDKHLMWRDVIWNKYGLGTVVTIG